MAFAPSVFYCGNRQQETDRLSTACPVKYEPKANAISRGQREIFRKSIKIIATIVQKK